MLHAWARVMLHERTPTVGALLLRDTYVWLTLCSPTTKHRVLSHRCGDYRKKPSLTASQDPDSRGAHFRFMTRSLRALRKAPEASSSPTVTQRERSCASLNLHPCFSPHLTSFPSLLIGAASFPSFPVQPLYARRPRQTGRRSQADYVHLREVYSRQEKDLTLIPVWSWHRLLAPSVFRASGVDTSTMGCRHRAIIMTFGVACYDAHG